MSGHSEDPVAEESQRFFTFFNLSMFLVAITGIEIVIIYVQTFDGAYIIGILFTTSVLKFIGVIWWFMHLRWDKILNTILFLMGLVIAVATYIAVIYMGDSHPVIEKFEVTEFTQDWEPDKTYSKDEFVKVEDSFYQSLNQHTSAKTFKANAKQWKKVNGVPHEFSWKITQADTVEIHSEKPENPFFLQFFPTEQEIVEGSKVSLLAESATTEDFRIKVRSEAFWTENQ
ncbi:MAG: cytochrome C oxidase subunit IV family protein [Verrucomicrobiota bacterium]|nr:cytochrome C oxidase subunit IV family protein [Verrucomicrobiota bacterium]|tara:strand:- start:30 stop:716 length:687 start_codon:yes stop_codon:yes gene_type:complete